MKKPVRILLPLAAIAIAFAAVSGYLVAQEKETSQSPAPLLIETDNRPIERVGGAQPTSYAPMLSEARKSVVSVYTSEVVRYARRSGSREDQILRQLFGIRPPSNQRQGQVQEQEVPQGVGSGVIISPDGYILTNNHVVQDKRGGDADKILVRLSDDTEMEAELIGRDPKTDIAVIKIKGTNLPFAKVADSDQVMVGDIVFAIGNPLGIGLTVTSGIISATGRSIGIYGDEGFEEFIQTDASINQGNSGGALVDIEGRLIGVNSAIASNSGGSIGLGFAIPTNLATRIGEKLTQSGEIKRGLLGVRMRELDPRVAEAMGAKGIRGVLVEESIEGYPAMKAGIRHGDIIVRINKREIDDLKDISLEMHKATLGETLNITVLRDAKRQTYQVELADPEKKTAITSEFVEGIAAKITDAELRQTYRIPEQVNGLVITETAPESPFAQYLRPGAVILEINKRPVTSLNQARSLLRQQGDNLIFVYANNRTSYFALRQN